MDIVEIFSSINGEVCYSGQGSLAVFVRVAGCNLSCKWCDTKQAILYHGKEMTPYLVAQEVIATGLKNVTITGGEPMLQYGEVNKLCRLLKEADSDIKTTVETNGTFTIRFPYADSVVYDYKLDGSGMNGKMPPLSMFISHVQGLRKEDWVKFVVATERDFYQAVKVIEEIEEEEGGEVDCGFAFSPVNESVRPRELAEWMLEASLPRKTVLNVQIHKIIRMP